MTTSGSASSPMTTIAVRVLKLSTTSLTPGALESCFRTVNGSDSGFDMPSTFRRRNLRARRWVVGVGVLRRAAATLGVATGGRVLAMADDGVLILCDRLVVMEPPPIEPLMPMEWEVWLRVGVTVRVAMLGVGLGRGDVVERTGGAGRVGGAGRAERCELCAPGVGVAVSERPVRRVGVADDVEVAVGVAA